MIIEDYVSFETTKLLKEKGFNTPLLTFYVTDKEKKEGNFQTMYFGDDAIDNNHSELCFIAPTQAMAMKWLREVHGLFIRITENMAGNVFEWSVYQKNYGCRASMYVENSYEQACESAISYCLKVLI